MRRQYFKLNDLSMTLFLAQSASYALLSNLWLQNVRTAAAAPHTRTNTHNHPLLHRNNAPLAVEQVSVTAAAARERLRNLFEALDPELRLKSREQLEDLLQVVDGIAASKTAALEAELVTADGELERVSKELEAVEDAALHLPDYDLAVRLPGLRAQMHELLESAAARVPPGPQVRDNACAT
jgi:hypothetical protein